MKHNPPEVKSINEDISVYFYTEKEKGYHYFILTLDNAVAFFRQIKKASETNHKIINVPIFNKMMDKKGTMKFHKEDLEKIRPLLADELNYRTGKKERPPNLDTPDWRKVLGEK